MHEKQTVAEWNVLRASRGAGAGKCGHHALAVDGLSDDSDTAQR